jgi:hypothetical protein
MLNKFVETSPCTAWDNPKKSAASSPSSPKTPAGYITGQIWGVNGGLDM